jgi:hypothetical protein
MPHGIAPAKSKMSADCEVLYIPVFSAQAKMGGRLLALKEASDARGNQMELPI